MRTQTHTETEHQKDFLSSSEIVQRLMIRKNLKFWSSQRVLPPEEAINCGALHYSSVRGIQ